MYVVSKRGAEDKGGVSLLFMTSLEPSCTGRVKSTSKLLG